MIKDRLFANIVSERIMSYMFSRKDTRKLLGIFFGITFLITSSLTIYLLETDKTHPYISGLLTLSLFAFFLTAGNFIILILKKMQKKRELLRSQN